MIEPVIHIVSMCTVITSKRLCNYSSLANLCYDDHIKHDEEKIQVPGFVEYAVVQEC